jgi:hypothetical protein
MARGTRPTSLLDGNVHYLIPIQSSPSTHIVRYVPRKTHSRKEHQGPTPVESGKIAVGMTQLAAN